VTERTGIASAEEIAAMMPDQERLQKGPVALFECFQNIPCNPCGDACVRGAIQPFADINERPVVDWSLCNGCGLCLTRCPGLAIFVVDYTYSDKQALVKIPFEFLPLPEEGERVAALDRSGHTVGEAQVIRVQNGQNKTAILWLAVAKELMMEVRNIRREEGVQHE
jgi:Fe-S-cluster-containing hydrogenase component 2